MRETTSTQGTVGAINRGAGLAVLVGLGLLGLAWVGAGKALATFPGYNGQIAFQSNRDGVSRGDGVNEIYSMNPDGGCPTRLTENSTFDGFPAWSPNGRKIAFRSNRDGVNEIYVMNADGSNQTRLTNNDSFDGGPAWAPDGRKIAFRSDRDGAGQIYVMNANGSEQTRLTHSDANDGSPTWSPDGRRIAFVSNRDGIPQIYVMNSDGSGQERLTHNDEADDGAPNWSPNGRRIAFDSNLEDNYDIYSVNADGSDQTRLTDHRRADGGPVWSPDGRKIAFRTNRDGLNEIYVMNADGSEQIRLTNNQRRDRRPSWQTLSLPLNRFCLGKLRQDKRRGFVRQRVRVPGPGIAIVRRTKRVLRFVREVDEAGRVGVLVRPRGRAKRILDRAGTVQRRMEVNVRARIAFKPEGGRPRGENVRLKLIKVRRR